MNKKVLIFDGNYILRRSFYGVAADLHTPTGFPTNAIKGSLNIILNYINKYAPDQTIIAYDVRKPTFRHLMYNQYKAQRTPAPEEFIKQREMMPYILKMMGLCVIEKEGYEADDIIGTIAKKESNLCNQVYIISADHDLLQLCDHNISLIVPNTPEEIWTPKEILAKYKVTPQEFIEVKALQGDSSDNIPGAEGIGPVTASKLISEYKTIFNIYMNIDKINGNKIKNSLINCQKEILMSRMLVQIKTDVQLDEYDDSMPKDMLNDTSLFVLEQYGLNSIINILKNGTIVRIS